MQSKNTFYQTTDPLMAAVNCLTEADEPVNTDVINAMQEQIFNEINNAITAQLVTLGKVLQSPQSFNSVVYRLQ